MVAGARLVTVEADMDAKVYTAQGTDRELHKVDQQAMGLQDERRLKGHLHYMR